MNDTTHYAECWREPGHQACAVAEVVRLRDVLYERSKERDEAQRDAARYRWLKSHFRVFSPDMGGQHSYTLAGSMRARGPSLDAAIDLAMEGTQAP